MDTEYAAKLYLLSKDYKVTDSGDYYLSIAGSLSDGFHVHFYRKLGSESVTSEHKTEVMTYDELLEFLRNRENLLRGSPRCL